MSSGAECSIPDCNSRTGSQTTRALRAARAMLTVTVLFVAMDAVMKVLAVPAAVLGTVGLGCRADLLVGLGLVQALCPGAVLWTAYLGGAVATHIRIGNPLFTHVLSPVYVAALLWG